VGWIEMDWVEAGGWVAVVMVARGEDWEGEWKRKGGMVVGCDAEGSDVCAS
jgi:hypothetical protein